MCVLKWEKEDREWNERWLICNNNCGAASCHDDDDDDACNECAQIKQEFASWREWSLQDVTYHLCNDHPFFFNAWKKSKICNNDEGGKFAGCDTGYLQQSPLQRVSPPTFTFSLLMLLILDSSYDQPCDSICRGLCYVSIWFEENQIRVRVRQRQVTNWWMMDNKWKSRQIQTELHTWHIIQSFMIFIHFIHYQCTFIQS